MKKVLSIVLIAILALAICMSAVYATTSFTVALSATATKVEQGGEVTVTVALKNFTPGETGINAIHLTVDYDKAIFETLTDADITTAGGWTSPTFNPANGAVVTENSTFKAENHDFLTIKFKVKETANVGNAVISIKDVEASDASNDIHPSDQQLTVNVTPKATTPDPVPDNKTPDPEPVENKTPAPSNPKTGIEDYTVPAILTVTAIAAIAYVKYTRLEK